MTGSSAAADVAVIGNVNVDLVVRAASELPPPGAEWTVDAVDHRPGGAAANTALGLAALGIAALLVGAVGDDALGVLLRNELAVAAVPGRGIRSLAGMRTGVSIAFEAPGRERSFLTFLGSLAALDASMVPDEALRARFVLFCGTFLLPALAPGTPRLMAEARAAGGTVLLDTGWDPAGWPPENRDAIIELAPFVDVFLPNAAEAMAITGEADLERAVRALQRMSGAWIVTKLGADGFLAAGPDGARHWAPAPAVSVVDTVGAGDAFNAGLIAAMRDGASVPDAGAFATRVASTLVSRSSSARHPRPDELVPGPP